MLPSILRRRGTKAFAALTLMGSGTTAARELMAVHEFDVSLFISSSHSFFDGSGVLRGMSDLARARTIRLTLRDGGVVDPRHRTLVRFDVARSNSLGMRRVVIDLADRADYFSAAALAQADVYFKRSLSHECLGSLALDDQRRIKAYGLNIACLGFSAAQWHIRAAALLLAQRVVQRPPLSLRNAFAEFIAICRLATGLPRPAAFAASTRAPPEPIVILQSRIWPPQLSTDDLQQVNAERIAIVQRLQTTFGAQFVGGILADSFSESVCPPNVLVHRNRRRGSYLKLVTSAAVGVYVRGLSNAIAIKMAEYLAAGLCIVSEPITHELPVPLVAGVNYLSFRSLEECTSQCEWLLAHPSEAQRMRQANLEYYAKWVEPKAHVYNLLTRSFE